MRALVVYESMFGNTQDVARAIAEGLGDRYEVTLQEVGHAPRSVDPTVALLVVGGPTHAFGMSRNTTRASAEEQAEEPLVSVGEGLREWLAHLEVTPDLPAATFDTKADQPWLPGSAANAAARRLRGHGCRLVARPASFLVSGVQGPLVDGELDRAREFGRSLGAAPHAVVAEH
ncbi:flavodoxin family protein [Nitriliruptoraceae bacterium ZYF776]|nr:flavodoxin family protein [Profundirhabdus halotolerans]